jgi:hypothetical protein
MRSRPRKDVPLGAFMRCDRGDKPADHHTLFLAQLPQKSLASSMPPSKSRTLMI